MKISVTMTNRQCILLCLLFRWNNVKDFDVHYEIKDYNVFIPEAFLISSLDNYNFLCNVIVLEYSLIAIPRKLGSDHH